MASISFIIIHEIQNHPVQGLLKFGVVLSQAPIKAFSHMFRKVSASELGCSVVSI
jgi:hypothetical protein